MVTCCDFLSIPGIEALENKAGRNTLFHELRLHVGSTV